MTESDTDHRNDDIEMCDVNLGKRGDVIIIMISTGGPFFFLISIQKLSSHGDLNRIRKR